jgi:hypothetical protein
LINPCSSSSFNWPFSINIRVMKVFCDNWQTAVASECLYPFIICFSFL